MRTNNTLATANGITWYYEQEGTGPDIVLVPEGYGDCHMFDKPMQQIASQGFRVTTFDMPGLSRSSKAPPSTYKYVTAQKLATYIISLLDALEIEEASFWGSSSGGSAVLAILVDHPDRVRSAMVHEVPTYRMPRMTMLASLPDEDIRELLSGSMKAGKLGDPGKWAALGDECHARLRYNFPLWARGYPETIPSSSPVHNIEALKKKPLYWSIGADTPKETFADNVTTATKIGATLKQLPGMHYPYVTHPEEFAEHVIQATKESV
ncbi:unnamed protein product [Clonostachys chloroleuca]|uniref:AB hydrolase-1 domain-containing protein n=1 Tax=Clonostachys chloroleuca TaxID=1926264 RepID=A0AA35PWA9_9HYPO|nr:unnamed protein product [Clonostachys chloroleuca]